MLDQLQAPHILLVPIPAYGKTSIIRPARKSDVRLIIEFLAQVLTKADGKVIRIPGIPPMYEYEAFTQTFTRGGHDMIMQCDGVFLGTSPAYDGESLAAFEEWVVGTLHKPVYAVGPLLRPGYGTEPSPLPPSPRAAEIQTFLDSMRTQHGDKYPSGPFSGPRATVPEQLEELVDALTDKKFPFIFCHASPFATVSDALVAKIKASGVGLSTPWAPQQFVLNHPVTGWFLTHCRHGGIIESLASGVPMICWPFDGDQPMAAEYLTQNLKVAFHFIEVRTGKNGLRPLYSGRAPEGTRVAVGAEIRAVIDLCRGEAGAAKRKNVERLKGELAEAWAAGGSSQVAMQAFFAKHVPGDQ
ncbi:hypothetical protein DFH07DRAFT_963932 [Mycena maculata]|uniref:Uncharacterized protein n=1 Tax=Mycena maculata TaxID=230809 RepID=A0AAD7IJZ1_9AGAR|nr:hypothetical protein DFH07DRAFT_963932 [Mycena maculata]